MMTKKTLHWGWLLLLVGPWAGAQPVLQRLQQQLANHHDQTLQEKLFAHTDRSVYVAGERLWFRLFAVDGTTHRPLDVSRVAYVEVLDKDQRAVAQAKVALDSSRGDGSLLLSTALPSGTYALRAYTQWMKATSPGLLFEKPITVINTFRRLGTSPTAETATADSLSYDAQFFPEGGHLVGGLPGRVAFRLTDGRTGRGVDCRGALLGPANDTLTRFRSLNFGLGTFAFTPAANARYRVLLTDRRGRTITRPLPAIDETGYSFQVDKTGDGQLRVNVYTNQPGASTVYLIGHTRQVVRVAEAQPIANGRAQFLIPEGQLGEGISHLTLFDAAGQPLCERLYGKRPQPGPTLQLTTPTTRYAPRDRVQLDLTARNAAGTPQLTDASVSVYRVDSLQTDEGLTLPDYLWLTSDLVGPIESPDYYRRDTGPDADQALDNLLLTHGWRRFRWEAAPPSATASAKPLPEHRGHVVLGRITQAATGTPAPNVPTYLAIPGKAIWLHSIRSDTNGLVRFELPAFYGTHDLVLQTASGDSLYRLELLNTFTETATTLRLPAPTLTGQPGDDVQVRSLAMQVQNSYFHAYDNRPATSTDSTTFYGQPDERYFLDRYTRFTVMEEVLSEYVPGVLVRRSGGRFALRVSNLPYHKVFEEDPLILLDGVPVYDIDRLMAFSPLKIKSLDVITKRYLLGYANLSGIISFKTYKSDLAGFQLDPRAVVLEYDGLQARREFAAPRYDTPAQIASRLPDFRTLLYWNPHVSTDATGKATLRFTTSDQEGRYRIVVNALTPDGRASTSQHYIIVQGTVK